MDESGVRLAIGSGESGGGRAGDLLVNRKFKPLRGVFGKSVGELFSCTEAVESNSQKILAFRFFTEKYRGNQLTKFTILGTI